MQIQAYLDNVFDVGALLEDTETKNAVLEHMEELQEQVTLVRTAPELGPVHRRPTRPHNGIWHWASNIGVNWGWPSAWLMRLTRIQILNLLNPLGGFLSECSPSSYTVLDL